ncbi:MAG: nitroreductase family protein [Pseudomonadaceae bacterium]|nr:nitroreductase family protein [Pseudomonadaceae bacterium]
MELFDVMRTTFAARDFTEEPVDDATLYRILDNARFAPSGGNRQGWKVIAVRETATRDALRPMLTKGMQRYFAQMAAGESPWNTIHPTSLREEDIAATELPSAWINKLIDAPVLLFVFVDLSLVASFDKDLERVGVISGASIYPFVWNILLAARNEGLGGVPTTFIAPNEDKLQSLLGVPAQHAFSAMIPLGKPIRQLTKLRRKPVSDFAVLERWDGPALSE